MPEMGVYMLENLSDGTVRSGGAHAIHERLQRRGYRFSPEQVATFYGALKAKGFVILAGLSGTGKTRLAQEFAVAMGLKNQFCWSR